MDWKKLEDVNDGLTFHSTIDFIFCLIGIKQAYLSVSWISVSVECCVQAPFKFLILGNALLYYYYYYFCWFQCPLTTNTYKHPLRWREENNSFPVHLSSYPALWNQITHSVCSHPFTHLFSVLSHALALSNGETDTVDPFQQRTAVCRCWWPWGPLIT